MTRESIGHDPHALGDVLCAAAIGAEGGEERAPGGVSMVRSGRFSTDESRRWWFGGRWAKADHKLTGQASRH